MAHAGIKNTGTLLGLRLLLGAFEAGFVPTCFYYLGTLYPHYMLGFRLGLFAGMVSRGCGIVGDPVLILFSFQSRQHSQGLLHMVYFTYIPLITRTGSFCKSIYPIHGVDQLTVPLDS